LCIESVRSLFHSVDLLKSLGYSDKVSSDIVKIIAIYDQVISLLRELNNIAGEMNGFMPKETSSLADCYNVVAINKDFIESLPDIVLKELRPQYALASTKNFLDKAREECELLVKRMTAHSAFFNVRYVPAPARINELVRGLLKYRDSLFAFFSKEYREIKRSVKAFLKNPKSFKVKELNDQLESLTDTLNQVENIQKNEGYISALGSLYLGINTNWDRLAAYIDWGQNLSKAIGTERQAHSLISNISEIHQELPNFASIIEEKLKNIEPTKELLNIDEKTKNR